MLKACENVDTTISDALIGSSPFDQGLIDGILKDIDGTHNYANIGANAALGVSMAVARAAAKSLNIPSLSLSRWEQCDHAPRANA